MKLVKKLCKNLLFSKDFECLPGWEAAFEYTLDHQSNNRNDAEKMKDNEDANMPSSGVAVTMTDEQQSFATEIGSLRELLRQRDKQVHDDAIEIRWRDEKIKELGATTESCASLIKFARRVFNHDFDNQDVCEGLVNPLNEMGYTTSDEALERLPMSNELPKGASDVELKDFQEGGSYAERCLAVRALFEKSRADAAEASRDEWKDNERVSHELFEAATKDLAIAQNDRDDEVDALKSELETANVRLAACGVAAMQNTESATENCSERKE